MSHRVACSKLLVIALSTAVAAAAGTAAAAAPDGVWRHQLPWPTAADITDLAADGTRIVGVTSTGQALVSDDAAVWLPITTPADELVGVAHGDDGWVAVGRQGDIVSSHDGRAWRHEHVTLERLWAVTACGEVRVATGRRGLVATSTAGGQWHEQWLRRSATMTAAACHGDRFVLLGEGIVWTSDDGLTWQEGTADVPDLTFEAVAWTGIRFEALARDHPHYYLLASGDGATWTTEVSDLPASPLDLAARDGELLVVGGTSIPDIDVTLTWWARRSTHGDWTVVRNDSAMGGLDRIPRAAVATPEAWVFAGNRGLVRAGRRFDRWVAVDTGLFGLPTAIVGSWQPILVTAGRPLIYPTGAREEIWVSDDGMSFERTWNEYAPPPIAAAGAAGRGFMVLRDPSRAVRLLVSPDGRRWRGEAAPTTFAEDVNAVAHRDWPGHPEWLLLGWNGVNPVTHQRDGLAGDWQTTILDFHAPLRAAADGPHGWIAVGDEGWIVSQQADGSWSAHQVGAAGDRPPFDAVAVDEDGVDWIAGGRAGRYFYRGLGDDGWREVSIDFGGPLTAAGATWALAHAPQGPRLWMWAWQGQTWEEWPAPPADAPVRGVTAGNPGPLAWTADGSIFGWETDRSAVNGASATLAVAADLAGIGDTRWRTDARVVNTAAAWDELWLRPDKLEAVRPSIRLRLPPGSQARLDGLIGSWLDLHDWKGPIQIRSRRRERTVVMARIATDGPGGRYGQAIPGDAGGTTGGALVLPMVRQDGRFRSNLGLDNPDWQPRTVELRLVAADGAVIGTEPLELAPFSFQQLDRVVRDLSSAPVTDGHLEIVPDGQAIISAYLSVVDGRTGDPSLFTPLLPLGSDRAVIGAIAATDGNNGSRWRSDVQLVDLGGDGAAVWLRPLPGADWDGATTPLRIEIPAGGSVLLEDIVQVTFEATGTAALELEIEGGEAGAACRTYTVSSNGSFGQAMTAVWTSLDDRAERERWLAGIEETADARTNLGLVNPGDAAITILIELRSELGEILAAVEQAVGPGSLVLLPGLARQLDLAPFRGAIRLERLESGAPWEAWASLVDASSNDPITIPAVLGDR